MIDPSLNWLSRHVLIFRRSHFSLHEFGLDGKLGDDNVDHSFDFTSSLFYLEFSKTFQRLGSGFGSAAHQEERSDKQQ